VGGNDQGGTLRFPQMRDELVVAINDLTEPLAAHPADEGILGFNETYLLLMEDMGLQDDPRRGIGGFLKNEEEAAALARMKEPLERVFNEVGDPYAPDEKYEATASWRDLVAAAKAAAQVIR
jgi:hypothetical protein